MTNPLNAPPDQDRRSFIKTMGGTSAALAVVPALLKSSTVEAAAEADITATTAVTSGRTYVAGKYAIELDGSFAGYISSVEGGGAAAEVVVEPLIDYPYHKKHLGNVKYEDISITCGTGMSKAFYSWMQDSFDRKYSRKNGAVIAADFNLKEHSRLTFYNALITEIRFPTLDAASKDAAKLTVKFQPESSSRGEPSLATLPASTKQKAWLASNFRLTIDKLDCSRVSKIEALTIKQNVQIINTDTKAGVGGDEQAIVDLEIPNLVITLPESSAESFYQWFDDFVIQGHNSDESERNGRLDWLTTDGKFSIGTLEFFNVGIFKLTPEKVESGSESIRRIKAEMYCENMKFSFHASS